MKEIWHVGRNADVRLKQLGLNQEDLRVPLDRALGDALTCTDLDAPSCSAFMFWSRANRYIREQLLVSGWTHTNRDHVLRTIDPETGTAITAISGAGDVGVVGGSVETKNPKGAAVAKIVRRNQMIYGRPDSGQLAIPGLDLPTPPDEEEELDSLPTWFLLYKRTEDSIVSELSLPVDMVGKTVNEWLEHIVLSELHFPDGEGGLNIDMFRRPDGDEGPDVMVEPLAA